MNTKQKRIAPQELYTIWNFADEFLVVCPRCSLKATVRPSASEVPARLTCANCGSVREWTSEEKGVLFSKHSSNWPDGQYAIGDSVDPYFHLPLWLQTSCGQQTLWAFNMRHLQFIRDYVAAEDRRSPPRERNDPLNSLLASRLPKWMKSARNRDTVLRAIEILEAQNSG